MKNNIQNHLVQVLAVVMTLTMITFVTGCSQKSSAADSSAQIQAMIDKAVAAEKQQVIADQQAAEKSKHDADQTKEKRKQEATASAENRQRLAEERRASEGARYQQAMASHPAPTAMASLPPLPANRVICPNCGMVVSINPVEAEGQGSALGVIAGGAIGGLLGNQVGNGSGRDLATIAGVFGGAIAGNKIEKNANKTTTYSITVNMDNGKTITFKQATLPSLAINERVKIENDTVVKF